MARLILSHNLDLISLIRQIAQLQHSVDDHVRHSQISSCRIEFTGTESRSDLLDAASGAIRGNELS